MPNERVTATIHVEWRDRHAIIHVAGELDAVAASPFEETVRQTIEGAPVRLVLELSRLTFIDSLGVGCLVRTHRLSNERQVAISIASPRGMVARLLKETQLYRVLPAYPSLDEALSGGPADPNRMAPPGRASRKRSTWKS